MKKSFKFRIYPNALQEQKLLQCLSLCRNLYNCALEERRNCYSQFGKSLSYFSQCNSLSEIKENCPEYNSIHSQVLQDSLKRLDKSFKAFFRRIKSGEKPGFPRFLHRDRYKSFTYPQSGFRIDKRLHLSKIGAIKINLHRQIDGQIKTCSIIRSPSGKWFACFSCEIEKQASPKTGKIIGIDFGIKEFITTSDNSKISLKEKFLKKSLSKLTKAQKRKEKSSGSKRYVLKKHIARIHEKVYNQRNDWQHKAANRLIRENDVIIIEDLSIQNMMLKSKLGKAMRRSIADVSWGSFIQKLTYKAEYAGKKIVKIDPNNTSKRCSQCGKIKEDLELHHRIYQCDECKNEMDRDYNAALNIKSLGLHQLKLMQSGSLGIQAPIVKDQEAPIL